MSEQIIPQPFTSTGRILMFAIVVGLAAIWIISLYAFSTLPDEIITHFGLSGKPDSYGDKSMFLILPVAFSIAPVILIIITALRFTLVNKYPYLINLPAFYSHLHEIAAQRKGLWVNKYFDVVLALGATITLYLLVLLLGILKGVVEGQIPGWFLPVTLAAPLLMILPSVYAMKVLAKQMNEEISQSKGSS